LYQLKNNPPPFLQGSSLFQTDGRFDLEKYMEAILNPGNLDWRPIEEFMQNIYLPNYKLQQLIIHSASTADEDIRDNYRQRFVNYSIEAIHITDKALDEETPQPSEEELMAAYNENIDDYKQPEMRYMKYVKWPIVSDYNDSLRVQLEAGNLIQRIHQGASFSDIANKNFNKYFDPTKWRWVKMNVEEYLDKCPLQYDIVLMAGIIYYFEDHNTLLQKVKAKTIIIETDRVKDTTYKLRRLEWEDKTTPRRFEPKAYYDEVLKEYEHNDFCDQLGRKLLPEFYNNDYRTIYCYEK
jgi:hypothetical protein